MRLYEDLELIEQKLVKETLINGRYFLLLGSGISLDSKSKYGGMEGVGDLIKRLVDFSELPTNSSLQQAYGFLSDKDVENQITDYFKCTEVGDTAQKLALQSWRRIFTLNIDDCLESSLNDYFTENSLGVQYLESVTHSDDFTENSPEKLASIVHLHGSVIEPEKGYVFSYREYAKNMVRNNSWMTILTQFIKSEPFIIAGTSISEIDVQYYLEQRTAGTVRTDRAASILIEPYPNKLTYRLCEEHDFVLFRGTVQKFYTALEHEPAGLRPVIPHTYLDSLNEEEGVKLRFLSTLETVPHDVTPSQYGGKFLLGANLTWDMLATNVDIARNCTGSLKTTIQDEIEAGDNQIIIILDEPGSGKTAILKRIAYDTSSDEKLVLWHTGEDYISPEELSKTLNGIKQDCYIFVDNWASNFQIFSRALKTVEKRNLIIVAAERSYRKSYLERAVSDFSAKFIDLSSALTESEAKSLISAYEDTGLSNYGRMSDGKKKERSRLLAGEPISVAGCRIQNNYKTFDSIVGELIEETSAEQQKAYLTASISKFCHATGLRKSILFSMFEEAGVDSLVSISATLPLKHTDKKNKFIEPLRTVVADRVVTRVSEKRPRFLLHVFINLAIALAPWVNRRQIRFGSPEAKLAGRLLNFDGIVSSYIGQFAEEFYLKIEDEWKWNSRYWEQVALLKLDRYLVDKTDKTLLSEAIQNARFAYQIEHHPLSLTTLAKLLFAAIEQDNPDNEELFQEAWNLITDAIEREKKWEYVTAVAFVVCFNGVLKYQSEGGLLSGTQSELLRDIVRITYSRRLHDPKLKDLRKEIEELTAV